MNHDGFPDRMTVMARLMAGLGVLGAVVSVLLRIWMPASNLLTVCVMLAVLLALGGLAFLMHGGSRREITGKPSLGLSVAMLLVGAALVLHGVAEVLARLQVIEFYSVTANPLTEEANAMAVVLPWLQTAFSVVGGVALVLAGMRIASEGGTRRGVAQIGMLAPVLWTWLVLANYMMTYASMVRVTQGVFTLGMYVMEMLFLFRFACYLAGVGKDSMGSLLFVSAGAVTFVLSAPLVRLVLYLLQDGEAYAASGAAGPLDLAVGVLALVVSITLCQSESAPVAEGTSDEDAPEWTGPSESASTADLIEEADAEDLIEE